MNIDQALIALCRKHDLTAITIQTLASKHRPLGYVFNATAHFEADGELECKGALEATAAEAIAHAIQQVNEARACVVEVPAMELECGA